MNPPSASNNMITSVAVIEDKPDYNTVLGLLKNIQTIYESSNANTSTIKQQIELFKNNPDWIDIGLPTLLIKFYPTYMSYFVKPHKIIGVEGSPLDIYEEVYVKYKPDPDRYGYLDFIQYPEVTERLKTGDCDDQAIFLANLFIYNGYKAKVSISQSHMWTEVYVNEDWLIVDSTLPSDMKKILVDAIKSKPGDNYELTKGQKTYVGTMNVIWNNVYLDHVLNDDKVFTWKLKAPTWINPEDAINLNINYIMVIVLLIPFTRLLIFFFGRPQEQIIDSIDRNREKDIEKYYKIIKQNKLETPVAILLAYEVEEDNDTTKNIYGDTIIVDDKNKAYTVQNDEIIPNEKYNDNKGEIFSENWKIIGNFQKSGRLEIIEDEDNLVTVPSHKTFCQSRPGTNLDIEDWVAYEKFKIPDREEKIDEKYFNYFNIHY